MFGTIWSQTEIPLDLSDLTVVGKRSNSRFDEVRHRSRSILEFRPGMKARDPNLVAEFVGETMLPGAIIWMYPSGAGYPLPAMTDEQAKEGRFSMVLVLKADAYSGGAVCSPAPLDLVPYLDKGYLEFWMKGAMGGEVFSIGLLDNGNNPMGRPLQVMLNSRSYAKTNKDTWNLVRIPLKAFGGRGSFWSEEMNARISSEINWTSISCLSVDIDKERHPSFKIWMDDAKIIKSAPGGIVVKGIPYPISNENIQDFPGSSHEPK